MFLAFLLRESAILFLNPKLSRVSITADEPAQRTGNFFTPRRAKLREKEAAPLGTGARSA